MDNTVSRHHRQFVQTVQLVAGRLVGVPERCPLHQVAKWESDSLGNMALALRWWIPPVGDKVLAMVVGRALRVSNNFLTASYIFSLYSSDCWIYPSIQSSGVSSESNLLDGSNFRWAWVERVYLGQVFLPEQSQNIYGWLTLCDQRGYFSHFNTRIVSMN